MLLFFYFLISYANLDFDAKEVEEKKSDLFTFYLQFDYFASIFSPGEPVIMYGMLEYNIPHSIIINLHQYFAFDRFRSNNFCLMTQTKARLMEARTN